MRCQGYFVWIAAAIIVVPTCTAQVRGTVELSAAVGNYFPTQNYEPGGPCFPGYILVNGQAIPEAPCDVYGSAKQRTFAPGGRVTAWVTDRIAFETVAQYSGSTVLDNLWAGSIRGLYTVLRTGAVSWYLGGGPGLVAHSGVTTASTTEHFTPRWGGAVGIGAHLRASPRFAFRADLEQYYTSIEGSLQQDLFFSLGLSFALVNTEMRHGGT